MNDDNAPKDFSGFDLTKRMLLPPMPNFHNLLDNLTFNRRENALVEFKASHRPGPKDASSKDECLWNVVKAVVAMANSVGGCILLGVDDDGNPVPPECGCDPDGVWKRRDEGHQLRAPLISELFKNRYDFRDEETGKSVRIEGKDLERNLKKVCPPECFLPCYDNAGSRVMAMLVTPVPPGEPPILVQKKQFAEAPDPCNEETICFFRDEAAANTESIVVQRLEWVQKPNTRPDKKRTDDGTGDSQLRAFSLSRRPYRRELWEIYKLGKLPPFALIPDVNRGFVGRKKELDDIRRLLLSDKHSVVIHGEGGSGKTELAIKFAHDCIAAFSGGVVFLNAERVSSWRDVMIALFEESASDLQEIKTAWKIDWKPGSKDESTDERERRLKDNADRALTALGETSSNRKTLLILDNLDGRKCRFLTEAEINSVFGQGGRGCPQLRILATARGVDELRLGTNARVALYPERRDEPLPLLDPESARTLLLGYRENVSEEEKSLADDIAGVLEYHPWSLEIASGQLADPSLSLRAFLRRIRDDVLRNESDGRTIRNNPESHAALLAPTLDLLRGNERRLARIVSMFPADGVETFVLRRVWIDFMGIPSEIDDRDSFRAAIERLARFHVVSIDRMNETVRMHRFTQRVLQEDMGAEKQTEADKISDFLAAWLGFTPFGHDRLRRFAETSLLGRRLLEEVEQAESGNKWTPLRKAFGFVDGFWGYHPFKDAVEKEGIAGIARQFDRRHWVYAYVLRDNDPEVEAFFAGSETKWNSIDRLVVLASVAGDYRLPFPTIPFSPREWICANRMNPSGGVFHRLGSLSRLDADQFDDWTSSDFAELTGKDWTDILLGLGINEPFEQRFETIMTRTEAWDKFLKQREAISEQLKKMRVSFSIRKSETELRNEFEDLCRDAWENDRKVWREKLSGEIAWNKLDGLNWLMLLNASPLWETLFSEHFGWSRMVDELCKAEKQGELVLLLKNHLEEYGDKFDWAKLPVPASAQSSGPSDWSGWWVETLDLHPEMSDRITPLYLGRSFWWYYSALSLNRQLIEDLNNRHPDWKPEIAEIYEQASSEVADR